MSHNEKTPTRDSLSLNEIRKAKYLAEHPTARVATGLPRINVLVYSAELLKKQRAFRLGADKARAQRKADRIKFRNRPRLELLGSASKPIDTRTDAARSRLYLEMGNGQILRCDRILGVRLIPTDWPSEASMSNNTVRRRGMNKMHASNPVLIHIALDAVEANSKRETAATTAPGVAA